MFEPIIIDVEASGFDPMSYPIEVGVALNSGQRYSSLIMPIEEWTHWDPQAEKVHRIPRETLLREGRSIYEVTSTLNRILQDKTVYTDGWVVDKPWLINLFFQARLNMQFHVSALEMVLSETQMEHWYPMKNKLIRETSLKRHRASTDAWIIQQTYMNTALMTDQ